MEKNVTFHREKLRDILEGLIPFSFRLKRDTQQVVRSLHLVHDNVTRAEDKVFEALSNSGVPATSLTSTNEKESA